MFQTLVGVLALGVLAVMVNDFTKSGSQGPAVLNSGGTVIKDFYGSLSG
jgi:hypothetical protein